MAEPEPKYFKCPGCDCIFFSKHDLEAHKRAEPFKQAPNNHRDTFKRFHEKIEGADSEAPELEVKKEGEWRPSNRGGGDYCLAERQEFLVKLILQTGDSTRWTKLPNDPLYEYRLSYRDGRPLWISRRSRNH